MKNFHRYLLYLLLLFFQYFFNCLPLSIALKLGQLLGKLTFYCLKKEQYKTIANLKVAFPEKDEKHLFSIGLSVFGNLGKNLIEWLRIPFWSKAQINDLVDEVEGLAYVDEALKQGNGGIVFTAHFGNWEMISAYFAVNGYRTNVIAKKIYYQKYNDFLVHLRSSHNIGIIYRTEPVRKLIKLLKDNQFIGILPDQDIADAGGVFVDFFGTEAYTPKGPVLLTQLAKSSLIPCFIIRKPNNKHKMCIKKPIEFVSTGDKEADIKNNTLLWSKEVESMIREYPQLWVWMHRRWKTLPKLAGKD